MWVTLPAEVRNKIRTVFSIPRSGATEVHDITMVSDGTTHNDFKTLTVEKMQEYLNDTSTDYFRLFDKVVAKVNDDLYPKPATEEIIVPKQKKNAKA